MTTPTRIEYRGPEGWIVWTDEDGVHVRTPKGDGLEAPDLTRLIELVRTAREHHTSGTVPAPQPPTRAEIHAMSPVRVAEYHAKRAARVVYDALAPDTPPF